MRRAIVLLVLLAIAPIAPSRIVTAADAPATAITALKIVDQKVGTGAQARDDTDVQIQYTGWLYDANAKDHHGTKFDSSYDSGHPLNFTVGADQVIAGLDRGIQGMRVGGKRTLIIPANEGYGRRGAGDDIPPNAALVFDIELLSVR